MSTLTVLDKNQEYFNKQEYFKYVYLKYFIFKYIFIFYRKRIINNIIIKFLNNNLIIYVITHDINLYNLKQQKYLEKSLNYLTKFNVKIHIININYNLLENKKNKKKINKIFYNYNKLITKKLKNFKTIFLVFIFALYFKNLKFLNQLLMEILKKTTKHFKFLKDLKYFLNFFFLLNNKIKGIRIQIRGRLNGSLRSKKYILNIGSLSAQTFKLPLYFHKIQSKTSYGICGIKLWVSFC
jgi:ribosomal protein S3